VSSLAHHHEDEALTSDGGAAGSSRARYRGNVVHAAAVELVTTFFIVLCSRALQVARSQHKCMLVRRSARSFTSASVALPSLTTLYPSVVSATPNTASADMSAAVAAPAEVTAGVVPEGCVSVQSCRCSCPNPCSPRSP
jgi:hypothetical protein